MKHSGSRGGFTLIEILVVLTIISILLGLVIGVAGPIKKQAAIYRAKTEISAIELGLTRFEIDNGFFPDAQSVSPMGTTAYKGPSAGELENYKKASRALFLALMGRQYFNSISTNNVGTQYLTDWKESQCGDVGTATDNTTSPANVASSYDTPLTEGSYLKDPFGLPYGYYYNSSPVTAIAYSNFNQVTYDLWCSAGETADPTGTDVYLLDRWVTNWTK